MLVDKSNSLLLIIDIQEKLIPLQYQSKKMLRNVNFIIQAAKIFNIPIIITEQYPKGIGKTIEPFLSCTDKIFDKTTFSGIKNNNIFSSLKQSNKKQIIICGIETHICVLQTAVNLLETGFKPYIIENATTSRNIDDKNMGIARMKSLNIPIISKEMVVYEWSENSDNPNFKQINKMIKEST